MKTFIKLAIAGLAFGCSCVAQAAIIQNMWTADIASINDQGNYFSASVGDSVSFTVTFDDSLHYMLQYDSAGNVSWKGCDRTAVVNAMYSDCTTNYSNYSLTADNISNSLWSAMSGLVGGIDVNTGIKAWDYSYSHDWNDLNSANDIKLVSSKNRNDSQIDMKLYDPSSSNTSIGNAFLYGNINGNNTYFGQVSFNNINMTSSAANAVSAPAGIAILGLALLSLAARRRLS